MSKLLMMIVGVAFGYAVWRASWSEITGRDHPYWDDPED